MKSKTAAMVVHNPGGSDTRPSRHKPRVERREAGAGVRALSWEAPC